MLVVERGLNSQKGAAITRCINGNNAGSDYGEVTAERLRRALIEDDADGAWWGLVVSGWVHAGAVRNREERGNLGGLIRLLGWNGGARPNWVLNFFFFL